MRVAVRVSCCGAKIMTHEIDRQKLADLIATAFPAVLAHYSPYKLADRIIEAVNDCAVIRRDGISASKDRT